MTVQDAVQGSFGQKLGEKQGLNREILVIKKSWVFSCIFIHIQSPRYFPIVFIAFRLSYSFTHSFVPSLIHVAGISECLLRDRLWGCSLVKGPRPQCYCDRCLEGEAGREQEGTMRRSQCLTDRVTPDPWKQRDKTTLWKSLTERERWTESGQILDSEK